jgi:hypothetical protein
MSSHEPLSKRLKRGDDELDPVIIAFGGPMYDEATARKRLREVVLVPADSMFAEDGEAEIGFDPDDAALDNVYFVYDGNDFFGVEITPMVYFAVKGDAKMCRYLISRGASTTKSCAEEDGFFCPMYATAHWGHLDICKVLYANGAQNDVRRGNPAADGWTPFHAAACHGYDELIRWFVLQGALCADGNSEEIEEDRVSFEALRYDSVRSSWQRLVEWAKEVTQTHSSVVAFLCGALPPAPDENQSRTLQCLSGHPGVRKHIGDFVGLEVTKGKQLRILRQVVDVLPSEWASD